MNFKSILHSRTFQLNRISRFNNLTNSSLNSTKPHEDVTNNKNVKSHNVGGRQNKFYFESSPLLKIVKDKNCALYSEIYNKIPVVLLFGWTGGLDKNLRKYSDMYTAMGYHVIRFSPSDELTCFNKKLHPVKAYRLLNMIKNELKLVNNPIITHSFSNASLFILYQHIIKEINQQKTDYEFFRANQKSAIFDSSPGWGKPSNLIHGIADLVRARFTNVVTRYIVSTLFLSMMLVYHFSTLGNHYFNNMFKIVLKDPRPVPCLFIYSLADILVDPANIANFILKKKKLFPQLYVKSIVYDGAEHVSIFQKYPEDYLKHVTEHLEYCKVDIKSILNEIQKNKNLDMTQLEMKF